MHAVILGSTGLVGSEVLKRLLNEPSYKKITVVGRRAPKVQHPKLEVEIFDLENLNQSKSLKEAEYIFCCLGTTIKKAGSEEAFRKVDYDGPLNAAKAASGHALQKFLLVSALGADEKSKVFYNRTKGELEKALASIPMPELHIFRPSLLLGDRSENRLGEKIAEKISKPLGFIFKGPLKRYKPVEARQVAHAMLQRALALPEVGHFYYESDLIQEC
jgi:uncharacterized protein YbjT (DUF2867 family)